MRRTRSLTLHPIRLFGLLALLGACASSGSFVDQTYRRAGVAYRVGALPSSWKRISAKGGDIVFRRGDGGTIAASSLCAGGEDVPLDVLTNHLLFGVERQTEHRRISMTLDGRAALRTQLGGEVDGVPVELDLVVLKKDGCTYDLQLIATAPQIARCQAEFEAFVQGFRTLPRK
jgi:hypothetical protein